MIFYLNYYLYFCKLLSKGKMSEWLKEHAWKACVLQKGTVGSNPTLSAGSKTKMMKTAVNHRDYSGFCF